MNGRRATCEVALVVVVVTMVSCCSSPSDPADGASTQTPPTTTPTPTGPAPAATAPAGMRLVGAGHVALPVPKRWGTNKTRCGTAVADTVIFTGGPIEACLLAAQLSDSVTLSYKDDTVRPPQDGQPSTIDGVRVIATSVTCVSLRPVASGHACRAAVFVPSERTLVAIYSRHKAVAQGLLDSISIRPAQVAVPNYEYVDAGMHQGLAAQRYLAQLRGLGLTHRVDKVWGSVWPRGYVLSVSPAVGTVLRPGNKVTVSVAS